jgi:hypothetical protein
MIFSHITFQDASKTLLYSRFEEQILAYTFLDLSLDVPSFAVVDYYLTK